MLGDDLRTDKKIILVEVSTTFEILLLSKQLQDISYMIMTFYKIIIVVKYNIKVL